MVRTSIDLKYIEDVHRRRVCFSKRRQGLMKKAHELAVLCDADIGLIVFSDSHKLYEFSSSDMTQTMMRYMIATQAPPLPSLEPQLDLSCRSEEKEAEIRSLKKKVMRLESEKKSLVEGLVHNQPIWYHLEPSLSLRPPFSDGQGITRLDNPKMEFHLAITGRPSKL
ncbi:transcription factor, MADS-box [Artemisia annua]|uniref:Transcription factor, MADS-box n=1 Tax=Artemisia annua TaxID=35608 RepID=A0A2U1PLN0_ARTAN|nr:transcription factor, MADS-box [Artemisia annua]